MKCRLACTPGNTGEFEKRFAQGGGRLSPLKEEWGAGIGEGLR